MQAVNLWKLHTDYSIVHAALLMAGFSPDESQKYNESDLGSRCGGYIAAKTAILHAVISEMLRTTRLAYDIDFNGEPGEIDVFRTLIAVSDLNAFTKARGLVCEFFDRHPQAGAHSTGRASPFFSKKLDAANKAWAAVTADPSRLVGKSPKQALQKWLFEHAEELGLLNKNGQPNQTGIDEICKVANWKPEGGATPTQSIHPQPSQNPLVHLPFGMQSEPRESFSADLDDEIPF